MRSAGRRCRHITLFSLIVFVLFMPSALEAQGFGGYGGGYGMMGRGGMMNGGPAGGAATHRISYAEAMRLIKRSTEEARVDAAHNRVSFTGDRILIAMAAVQPGFPDTTFEVAGRVDPTIVVPAGTTVTLLLVNMDYGPAMDHGVVISDVPPPYGELGMMGMPQELTGVPILPPRSIESTKGSQYAASSVTFRAPESGGSYYYLCQYRDHASKGMFGRFEVR